MSRPEIPVVDVVKRAVVDGELREAAWRMYLETFDELRSLALQRHLYTRAEFDHVMADEPVTKYVGRHLADDDAALVDTDGARLRSLCALATFTRDLTTMPLVSPEFFAARWPEHYERDRCFYIGFVGVHPGYQRTTNVFHQIVSDMTQTVAGAGGVAVLDVCTRNSEMFQLPQAILRIAQSHEPRATATPVDQQTYWAYEAPSSVDLTAVEPRTVDLRDTGAPTRHRD